MSTTTMPDRGRAAAGDGRLLGAHVLGLLVPIMAAGVAFVASIVRQEGVPKLSTLWAEDGSVFMHCAYFDPAPLTCFLQPYAGYLHAIPRLGGMLASIVPPAGLSIAVGLIAAAFAGFAALITARAIHRSTDSAFAAVMGGAAVALVYQAGREVGGEIANLHLTYFVASVVVITTGWLGRTLSAPDLILVGLFGLSSAFAPLLVPLAIVSAVLHASRWRALTAIVVSTAIAQGSVAILAPRHGAAREAVPLSTYLEGSIEVIRRGPFGGLRIPPDWLVTVGLVAVLGVLAACWLLRDRTLAPPADSRTPLRGIAVMVACVGAGVIAFAISVYINTQANPRYAYIPTASGVEALLIGAAIAALVQPPGSSDVRRGVRLACRVALPAVGLLLLLGFARSFFLEARASGGPDYVAGYGAARAACMDGAGSVTIRISPYPASSDWFVTIPCDRVGR